LITEKRSKKGTKKEKICKDNEERRKKEERK
jgi:hypothetical protein